MLVLGSVSFLVASSRFNACCTTYIAFSARVCSPSMLAECFPVTPEQQQREQNVCRPASQAVSLLDLNSNTSVHGVQGGDGVPQVKFVSVFSLYS